MSSVNNSNPDSAGVKNLGSRGDAVQEVQIIPYGSVMAGPIRIGTKAGSFHDQTERLKNSNPTRIEAEKAFKSLKAQVNKVVPHLVGKGNKHLTMVSMSVDCKHSLITITLSDGKTQKELTVGQLKNALAQIEGRSTLEVEKEIVGYFHKFDMAFLRIGISTLAHYSPKGPDVLGTSLGGKALDRRNFSYESIENKQSEDLSKDVKNKWGILSLIGHSRSSEEEKKKAVDKALRAESFLVSLQNSFAEMMDKRVKKSKQITNMEEKRTFDQATHRYKHLQDQLLEANRHALWASAIYDKPEECFKRILEDYHHDLYADKKEEDKPSFRDFCESSHSLPFRQHAAEIASLLITDAAQYRNFCVNEHGISPRDNHVNRLLNQALKEPGHIQFGSLGIELQEEEQQQVKAFISDALTNAGKIEAEVHKVAQGQAHADRLKTALAAKALFPLLKAKKP